MRRERKKHTGWTLVELLVVVAIIATLGAIVWAVMQPARQKAIETQCFSKMRQIWVALDIYRQDYTPIDPPNARTPAEAGLPLYESRVFAFFNETRRQYGRDILFCILPNPRVSPGAVCELPGETTPTREGCSMYELGYIAGFIDRPSSDPEDERSRQLTQRAVLAAWQDLAMRFPIVTDENHILDADGFPYRCLYVALDGSAHTRIAVSTVACGYLEDYWPSSHNQ